MAPFLPEPDADRRRQERPVRRLYRFRRTRHGPLREQQIAIVGYRKTIRAGRQFLHGRVRRVVSQSLRIDLRLYANLSERRSEPGQGLYFGGRSRWRNAQTSLGRAEISARGAAQIRQ